MQSNHTESSSPATPILSYPTTAPGRRWQDNMERLIFMILLAAVGSPLLLLGLLGCYIHLHPNSDFSGDLKFSIAFIVIGTLMLAATVVLAIGLRKSRRLVPHANPRH